MGMQGNLFAPETGLGVALLGYADERVHARTRPVVLGSEKVVKNVIQIDPEMNHEPREK